MSWSDVGNWLKSNAGTGATLVGSLLTGNVPSAVAAGVALVASATGNTNPDGALVELQGNPEALIKLKELAFKEEDSIRKHLEEMTRLELEDRQKEHEQTQLTIRSGDNSTDGLIRAVRPTHATISLIAAVWYGFSQSPSIEILGAFLILPFTYAGLRGVDKGIGMLTNRKIK